jgi:chitin synthase
MSNNRAREVSVKSHSSINENDEDLRPDKNEWKPAKFASYEVMGLASTKDNPIVRPCGFRKDGKFRKVKDTCMISRMRNLNILKDTRPKLAVCITMYNEDETELKFTMKGLI